MMNDTLNLALALLGGAMLGAIFFGGLWWTVRAGVSSTNPALWFLGSLLARMSIALTGFYLIGRGNWQRLLACLVGFIVSRWIVTYLTRGPEGNHAP